MSTSKQNKAFIEAMISTCLLDDAIEWIAANFDPEDVFPEKDLDNWADSNGYILE